MIPKRFNPNEYKKAQEVIFAGEKFDLYYGENNQPILHRIDEDGFKVTIRLSNEEGAHERFINAVKDFYLATML